MRPVRPFKFLLVISILSISVPSEGSGWRGFVRVQARFNDPKISSRTITARFGDLNNDGFPDLVFFKDVSTKSYVLWNDTMGRFRIKGESGDTLVAPFWNADGVIFNLDNNDSLDIFIPSDTGNGEHIINYNIGSYTFQDIHFDTSAHVGVEEARIFHANDDSFPDIVLAVSAGDSMRNRLYFQVSQDTFVNVTDSMLIPGDYLRSHSVVTGDVNNDSLPDIFFANVTDQPTDGDPVPNLLYFGTSGYVYRDTSVLLTPNDSLRSYSAEFGDVNGDGLLDIIIANSDAQNTLYINYLDSIGVFKDLSDSLLPSWDNDPTVEVNFADMDNDGDLDLFLGQRIPSGENVPGLLKNHIYLNDGDGKFEDATEKFNAQHDTVATTGNESDFADIDWDQDLDLFVARNLGSNKTDEMFINLYTQLFVYSKLPKPGQKINLVQTGIKLDYYEIWASCDTVFYKDPSHGWQRLDSRCDSLIVSGTLDSTEIDTVEFTIPNDTTLVGEDIFFQTIIGPDSTNWIYGNLEKVTVIEP